MESFAAIPWGWVLILGPVILGAALAWAQLKNRSVDRKSDPSTPSDDPSKGMTGHD